MEQKPATTFLTSSYLMNRANGYASANPKQKKRGSCQNQQEILKESGIHQHPFTDS
jgi:hypothetical protein